ncbi:hypothetical protein AR687_17110 [Flavobacteriaceae bacterium CRH]|nr:hypothetical protein AR687_17110 [Flavobacteriaceae bacterium CRH]
MKIIVTVIGLFLILLNLYVGSLYKDLYMRHIVNTIKRVSLKTLNIALQQSNKSEGILILKYKKYYILFLILFYIELGFVQFLFLK